MTFCGNRFRDVLLCFLCGFGNAVEPKYIGTAVAVVNGIMFIVGGIMISRPGVRIGLGMEEGVAPASLEMAQFAGAPAADRRVYGLCHRTTHARDLSTQARRVPNRWDMAGDAPCPVRF